MREPSILHMEGDAVKIFPNMKLPGCIEGPRMHFIHFSLDEKGENDKISTCFPGKGGEEGILRPGDSVISVLSNLQDHSAQESRPYGQPGPLPTGGFRPY